MFGRGELGEREVEAREIAEKLAISLVWQTKEIGERELKRMGPTLFLVSPQVRRNSRESLVYPLYPRCNKRSKSFLQKIKRKRKKK